MENKGLKKGDKIGDLYFEGDYGEGGLIGVKHIAEEKGLEVVEQKIKATDEDMSSAAATFKRAGVKAIWVTTGPAQLASLAGVAAAPGLNGADRGQRPRVRAAAARDAGGRRARSEPSPCSTGRRRSRSTNPEVKKVAAAYKKAYPKGVPQQAVLAGYSEGEVMDEVLKKACENKDLSREGLVKAFRTLSAVDTGGLVAGTLDFSKVGQPSSKAVFAHDVDRDAVGGERAHRQAVHDRRGEELHAWKGSSLEIEVTNSSSSSRGGGRPAPAGRPYRAKVYGPRATSQAKLEEVERAAELAESRAPPRRAGLNSSATVGPLRDSLFAVYQGLAGRPIRGYSEARRGAGPRLSPCPHAP